MDNDGWYFMDDDEWWCIMIYKDEWLRMMLNADGW